MKIGQRPKFLLDLEPELVAFGASIHTDEEATANGVPYLPDQRRLYLSFSRGDHHYVLKVDASPSFPFCSLSVRRKDERIWPVTHFVSMDATKILMKIEHQHDILDPTTAKPRNLHRPRKRAVRS